MKETKEQVKEDIEFLKSLKRAFMDIKEGRVQEYEFKHV